MSVDVPKAVEETPAPAKALPTTEEPATTVPATESTATAETAAPAVQSTETETTPAAVTEQPAGDDKVVVEAQPADEGILGYKAPGFLKQFVYSKHHFWFTHEPSTLESLAIFHRNEKNEITHSTTAWAQETGEGVLFYSKRIEDKIQPTGLILLADASNVTKEGSNEFSFIVNKKTHRFEAKDAAERDSWVVAIEKNIQAAKGMKEELSGRETYKKNLESFGTTAAGTAALAKTERSASKGPKKSLDAATATAAATEPETKPEVASVNPSEEETKKASKKDRSQSRKRQSVFGIFGGKTEEEKEAEKAKKEAEKEAKEAEKKAEKEAKEAEKAEKKAEAEHLKEEKKIEAEQKKEEAEATKEPAKAVEAAEAAAIAVAPAAVVAAVEDKKEESTTADAASPTDKKNKRASVFGFFGKKNAASPATEKSEKDAAILPTTEPVSETAPKIEEPIETKPIDAAAVTAPAETTETPIVAAPETAVVEETPKETAAAPAAETSTAPKSEKKGFLAGVFKRAEAKKEEHKEEKAAEEISKDPVVAAAPEEPVAETTSETPAVVAEAPKEERPTREKRRSSFFGLGKKKNTETDGEVAAAPEVKREKSPLPAKLGGLFRKPSKAVKPETSETAPVSDATATTNVETPANATIPEATESKIVGDVVPEELHTTVHDAVTTAPEEVKTSA